MLISQSVYDEVKDIFEVKAHGKHPLKGRAELVEIYEILKVKRGNYTVSLKHTA